MKKRILVIGPGMEIGGVERSLLRLLDAIDYDQYEVDLFLLNHTGELMISLNPNVHLLPENQAFALIRMPIVQLFYKGHFHMGMVRLASKLYGDIRGKIEKKKSINTILCNRIVTRRLTAFPGYYDYAFGFLFPHYLLTEKVNAKTKIGWVHTDYSNLNERPDAEYTLSMWENLDYIACVSKAVESSFHTVYPSLSKKTVVIENILSPELIKKYANEFDVTDEIPNDGDIRVLSIGRFTYQKNFDSVPEVCRKILNHGKPVKWYLIGYGSDEETISSKIREYRVEENVIILGKKDNPYPYIKACDIYVQPSRYEGKSVAVREAQILNKPVLITRYETSSSQLEEGIDGYICEMGVEGITDGLLYLVDHPEIRESLIYGTRSRSYDNFSVIDRIFSLQ